MSRSISIVVPTINSAHFIADTLAAIEEALQTADFTTEVIFIDDASTDSTWQVLVELAGISRAATQVRAIRLRKNVGQHASILCGLRESKGDYVITIDDDLQNDPSEISGALDYLISSDVDVVVVSYESFKKSLIRKLGSVLIQLLVKSIFQPPPNIQSSPFRLIKRPIVEKICATAKPKPFITGEIFLATSSIANFKGVHFKKKGRSNYKFRQIISLCSTILFSYSTKPTLLAIKTSLFVSTSLLAWGTYVSIAYTVRSEMVPGYASTMFVVSLVGSSVLLVVGLAVKSLSVALSELLRPAQFDISGKTK